MFESNIFGIEGYKSFAGETMGSGKVVRNLFTVPMKNMILLIVGLNEEAHGYEIMKEIENLTGGTWKPSHGNLYTMLGKMVEEGLLEPREEFQGRRRRVKYRLTEKGWEWLRESNEIALRSLYLAVEYHERLREKLRELGYGREITREAVQRYIELLDDVISILQAKRGGLIRTLEELNSENKTKNALKKGQNEG